MTMDRRLGLNRRVGIRFGVCSKVRSRKYLARDGIRVGQGLGEEKTQWVRLVLLISIFGYSFFDLFADHEDSDQSG